MSNETHPASTEVVDRWNIGRLLTWTTDFLKRKGSESPRLDAEVLLSSVLGCERVQLYTRYELEVDDDHRARFRDLVKRRSDGAPVAYLVGKKEFYALSFTVTPAVLIPRADSEYLVVEALAVLKTLESPRVVDVGTGSGCLALALAHSHKSVNVYATDLSENALAVARINAGSLRLAPRVDFRQGNLLEPVATEGPFDLILSNPPYIRTADVPGLEREVSGFEPAMALDGGVDGLDVYRPLIDSAIGLLKPGGHLIIEIGSDQESDVRSLIERHPELQLAPTIRDHARHPRVLRSTRINPA